MIGRFEAEAFAFRVVFELIFGHGAGLEVFAVVMTEVEAAEIVVCECVKIAKNRPSRRARRRCECGVVLSAAPKVVFYVLYEGHKVSL